MSDVKIISGKSTRALRARTIKQGEKDLLAGEDAVYVIIPDRLKGESEKRYVSRLWRLNKEAIQQAPDTKWWDSSLRDYDHFKKLFDGHKKALGGEKNPSGAVLKKAMKSLVRSDLTTGYQIARENTVSGLKKVGAWEQFKKWSRGSGKFAVSKMTYNEKEGRYEYGGKVAFKWEYKKANKKTGEPGGMEFTITNLKTGQSMTQSDLAEAATVKAMREQGFNE